MADAPEIPDASDPFGKLVALTVAILAVLLAVVSMIGDNAKGEAQLKTTEKANYWNWYQSKSLKMNIRESTRQVLGSLTRGAADAAERNRALDECDQEIARYQKELDERKNDAQTLEKEIAGLLEINDRCDRGVIFLQIAIVVGSVSLLIRWKPLWIIAVVLGIVGVAAAFFPGLG